VTNYQIFGPFPPQKRFTLAGTIGVSFMVALVITSSLAQNGESKRSGDSTQADPSPDKGKLHPQLETQRYPRYELRAEDVLDITFEFTPEFNQTVTIQPDGYISLREVGDVHVAGRSVPEVAEVVRSAYGKILQNPSMAIVLKDFEKPYFTAGGAVGRPGKYELRGDTTVVEAINIAGGFNDSAKHSQVVLYHHVSRDWMEGKLLDVKKMLKDKNLSEDLHLQAGDMIFVPQSTISKIRKFVPVPSMGMALNPAIP
jgi:polysaccharide export outer membrane protein